ncbi:TPA: hypothetical protein ACRNHZ_000789 [Pseudomonas aeruginosa]|uniref:hypothetical protein n=1 Tax=Pseudomonas aeruginosa TaxID=287 RepID=UPI0015964F73|nr:hypothetical protein [Pseudomonas aeruginosa]MBG4346192.1 hypothetical protein [Pseudomonas aeruginosa]MBG7206485.1 hypothetical protein [Pseudomonas aeruginosa]
MKFPRVKFQLEGTAVNGEFDVYREMIYEDPDFDLGSSYVQDVISRLGLAEVDYLPFFEKIPGTLLSWPSRRFYCQECLREDVKNNLLPCWRRGWCTTVSVFCTIHKKKLSRLQFDYDRIGRGWQAFYELTNTPSSRYAGTRSYDLWESEHLQQALFDLATKVFQWYNSDETAKADIAGHGTALSYFFDLVLELLTQAPSVRNSGGLAWQFRFAFKLILKRYRKGYSWLLRNGVNEVDINQRVCGVILAGKVLGVLSDEEVKRLDCMVDDLFPYFGLSNLELGITCTNYNSIEDYDYLRSIIGQFPCSNQKRFQSFLAGLNPER